MNLPLSIEIPEHMYQKLKVILEKEHGKEFPIEDVREIADNLVELYLLLSYLGEKKELSNEVGA